MSRTLIRPFPLLLDQAVKRFGKVRMSRITIRPLSLLLAQAVQKRTLLNTLREFDVVRLFRSLKAHLLWRTRTGQSMRSYSQTRWWSHWEVYQQLLNLFGDVLPFLEDLSSSTRRKLLAILRDAQKYSKLQLELAAVIDAGEPFVKATYNLEGDGPLVFCCFEVLASLSVGIRTAHFPNLSAISTKIAGGNHTRLQQFEQYGRLCVKPGLDYFVTKFTQDLSDSVAAFKAARLFVPQKVTEMQPTANAIDDLTVFPFLNKPTILSQLKAELPEYSVKAEDVSAGMTPLGWWKRLEHCLPTWFASVRIIVLIQPSSAAAKRVFSLLKATFNKCQDGSLQDYIEASLMFQYNKRD